jgi:hypothetical protein
MDAKTKEEIELLQELIDSPDTPQDEKELYRDTIKELKAEAEKSKPEPKKTSGSFKKTYKFPIGQVVWDKTNKVYGVVLNNSGNQTDGSRGELRLDSDGNQDIFSYDKENNVIGYNLAPYGSKDDTGNKDLSANKKSAQNILGTSTSKEDKEYYGDAYKDLLAGKFDKKPATPKSSATKKEAPKKLPVDADKMKAEIKERTGKTEEECEVIIAEYRQLREKSKKIEAKRLGKLDDEGKLIAGTKEKTAAAVIETAAENIKDKLEKQVDKLEKEAEKGDRTPEQIEARINKNLGQLSKEMTKQATSFIKGIQSELAKADKTEAKQFLMNVRAEIDDLLSKFGGGGLLRDRGWLNDRRQVNQREDYEVRYEKNNNTGRTNYAKKKNSVGSIFGDGGGVNSLSVERRAFLQELIDNGIIDEEHYYFEETTDAINSNDDEQMRVLIDEMVSSDIIDESYPNYKRALKLSKKQFGGGGGVDLNSEIILTENRDGGSVVRAVVKPFMLESIEDNQYKGGFKRYEIDIYDEVEREPTKKEIEELNSFFDKVGGRFDIGGFVQTYNITQGNMSSSSVNPSQFGEGGPIPEYEGERFSQEEFDYRLNLAKHQIISDIIDRTVDPTKVNDFGDLGAFVDHNYYGGFIEDDYDHSEGFVFEMSVQDALADWIEEGGITKALENPEMFAVGGSVEDAISNADARIANLRELRSVSNDDMRENLDFQIESIEREKSRLLSGELVPRKKLFGLF